MNESNKACEWFCWNNSCSRQMGYLGTKNAHNSGSAQKFSFFLKKNKMLHNEKSQAVFLFFLFIYRGVFIMKESFSVSRTSM